jgi:DNA polymerase
MPFDADAFEELRQESSTCTACALARERTQVVFGDGNPDTNVMFVGEGPGFHEDQQGLPFVGKAGQLLDKVLDSVGLGRDKVYIANVVKCRPPGNRDPQDAEVAACKGWLEGQFAIVDPRIVVVLGNVPKRALLGPRAPGITRCRGNYYAWRPGTVVVPFFHPSYLLRNDSRAKGSPKWHTWQDAQELKRRVELLAEGTDEARAQALEPTHSLPGN